MKTLILKTIVFTLSALATIAITSCTPTAYVVDTTTYADQIATTPAEVVVKPEHVKEVGGFQFEGGVIAETDNGRISLSERGVRGEILIDLTSPQSALEGGK